jgi:hypothetical protein
MATVEEIVRALTAKGVSIDDAMAQARQWAGKDKVYVVAPVAEEPYTGARAPSGLEGPTGKPTIPDEDSKGFTRTPERGKGAEPSVSLSAADQDLLDRVAGQVQSTLTQIIDTTALQQGPGQADIIIWTGRKIRVPFAIAGKSGTFVVSPVLSVNQGVVPVVDGPMKTLMGSPAQDPTLSNIWSNFPNGKVPKATNGGVLTGES